MKINDNQKSIIYYFCSMKTMVNFHTHNKISAPDRIDIINITPAEDTPVPSASTCYSAGVHPWFISKNTLNQQYNTLKKWASDNLIKLIGETGLDKLKGPELAIQTAVFLKHVELSETHSKPLIIHCVKAYNEIISLRKQLKPKQPWIFHGFNSSVSLMHQAAEAGFGFSFGPAILQEGSKAGKALEAVDENRFFLETDDTERCIEEIYSAAAVVRQQRVEIISEQIYNNFNNLFIQ
ncbi:TatD family deoxyribonuclease [Marinilabiliaceae bacterium JC017]|nr:TatD family deoxyribonuclease [Marinilabiliaceae bacterium JC017]